MKPSTSTWTLTAPEALILKGTHLYTKLRGEPDSAYTLTAICANRGDAETLRRAYKRIEQSVVKAEERPAWTAKITKGKMKR